MISPKARIITSRILTSDVQLSLGVGIKSGPILATESEVEPLGRRSRKAFFPLKKETEAAGAAYLVHSLDPWKYNAKGARKRTKADM